MLVKKALRLVSSIQPAISHYRQVAQIIDGKRISRQILDEVKSEIDVRVKQGLRRPHLTAVIVGEDPASQTYVRNKVKACEHTGITSNVVKFSDKVSERELLHQINYLNLDGSIDGIIVQLPVPHHISERAVCNAVHPLKDVDGFHVLNVGMFCTNLSGFLPPTPAGCLELIRRCRIETFGKNALVCGRSKNVGMPMAMLLHSDGVVGHTGAADATTTICHRYTPPEQLSAFCKLADIVIVATGVPHLIKAEMVKPGAAIIDIGINRIVDPVTGRTKLIGDVDFEPVSKVAGWITPVPGGVGPMTVAMLMRNTLLASKLDKSLNHMSHVEQMEFLFKGVDWLGN